MTHDCATPPQELPTRRQVTYLPSVQYGDDDAHVATHVDPIAAELIALLRNHNGQKRPTMRVNRCLLTVAREKAYTMSVYQDMNHVLGGVGPNGLVRQMCGDTALPAWYGADVDSNNVESIGHGYASPQEMVDAWVRSPAHSKHVLGLGAFFKAQIDVGAAVYWDALGHPFWAFVSAPVVEAG